MKLRPWPLLVLCTTICSTALPDLALAAAPTRAASPGAPNRSPVSVHPAFPIHRKPVLASHPDASSSGHRHHRHPWVQPVAFLPLIVWVPVIYTVPVAINGDVAVAPPASLWQQTAEVDPDDDWTELMFGVPAGGTQLLLTTDAPTDFDFAEIVYQDGTAQVVDLSGPTREAGTYDLAPLDPSRLVDHVRVLARAAETDSDVGLTLNP